eukprot:jgi/Botrbrau1/4783/Bobra.0325s0006.1
MSEVSEPPTLFLGPLPQLETAKNKIYFAVLFKHCSERVGTQAHEVHIRICTCFCASTSARKLLVIT